VERARFFSLLVANALQAPTRALARPVVVLLGSGFLNIWVEARSGPGRCDRTARDRTVPGIRPAASAGEKKLKLLVMASAGVARSSHFLR
jgi:hypothetical protein